MPFVAIFCTTTNVCHHIHATIFKERNAVHVERWREADVETAVSIKQCRVLAIEFHALLVGDEHRHACAVFAGVEHLFGDVAIAVELHVGLPKEFRLACSHIIRIDRTRSSVAGEVVEHLIGVLR